MRCVIAFLDDDDRLQGHVVNGLPIHSPNDLSHLMESRDISTVLLALPSAGRKRRNEILNQMLHAKVSLRTLLRTWTHKRAGRDSRIDGGVIQAP